MEQQNYTAAGFRALQEELDYLKNVRREENKKEIAEARSFGDLSENSEYDEAKNEQAKIAARILELENMINHAHVVDESEIDHDRVGVGSTVVVFHSRKQKEVTYHIVGSYETNPLEGKISDVSPIGIALRGAQAGDVVEMETPAGTVTLEVRKVSRANH